ncbi:hypothetical protein B7P43_G08084 [Cryptotermes secundus]|uniref:Uncharacterized protein n=1 Tax=Cryptotermes secundus TaxID=105785 RepID=A0A2J7R8B5_9NEOP|nr:hypothetical protein B7P43_G08084 [Cryptotermes secundus]
MKDREFVTCTFILKIEFIFTFDFWVCSLIHGKSHYPTGKVYFVLSSDGLLPL